MICGRIIDGRLIANTAGVKAEFDARRYGAMGQPQMPTSWFEAKLPPLTLRYADGVCRQSVRYLGFETPQGKHGA